MAITGPSVQMPDTHSSVQEERGTLRPAWASFFRALQQIGFNISRSGATASRPTSALAGRFVGQNYFDTTLGKPIWLKSVNPDVWVDATGAVV